MDKVLRNLHSKIKSLVTKTSSIFRQKETHSWDLQPIEDFIANYDPKKNLLLLWDIPEKFKDFYTLFFEDQHVFFLKSAEEYLHLSQSLSLTSIDITLIAFHNKSATLAKRFCRKYKIHFLILYPGLMGHPIYPNLSACFLDASDEMLIKRICSMELAPSLLEHAARLQHLYCFLHIGKSSSPSFIDVYKFLGPKQKKRVLILAHPGPNVSDNSLLRLALQENSEAEIYLYRKEIPPTFELLHEEIIVNEQTYHYKVISKTIRTTELIMACDHIYTNHAIEAVDAIFYHKKLTVTGKPFYAGWGLTDDRLVRPHPRRLTSNEFFAIIFLKCTRYSYDNHDPVSGLLSTMLDVAGSYAIQKAHTAMMPYSPEKLSCLRDSDYWPAMFNIENATRLLPAKVDATTVYPLGKKANDALTAAFMGVELNYSEITSSELVANKLQEIDLLIKNYHLDEAEKELHLLLQNGFIRRDVFFMLADICAATFHLEDAINLQEIAIKMTNPKTENYSIKQHESFYILGNAGQLLKSICLAIKSVPSHFIQAYTYHTLLQKEFGDFQYANVFFNASKCRLKNGKRTESSLLKIAHGFMLLQEPEKQLETLASIKNPQDFLKYNLSKVTAYIALGNYLKAREIVEQLLPRYPKINVYREAVRLSLLMNDFSWGEQLLKSAQQLRQQGDDILIESSLLKRLLLISNKIPEGFAQFRNVELCKILKFCLPGKYIQQCSEAVGSSVLVVMISGIGDEIRLATIYPKIAALFSEKRVSFTCEPRLLELFTRSYPNLNFIPVSRQRYITYKTDLKHYNELPNLPLHKIFDNSGWRHARNFDNVTLVTDLLADFLNDKNSFSKSSYLKADPEKVTYWSNRTKSSRIKIGLCWRSSLLSYNRNTGYLSIQHLKPLLDRFAYENIDFYNLQYDDATEELAWVEEHCQTKIIHFPDLDQYNDMDSVAAFMCCMDLVIAPPTAVIELAGALGRPSFLLSNIGEVSWRKTDEIQKRDVWSPSIVHIEGVSYGNRTSLVEHLIQAIEFFISTIHAEVNP